MTHMLSDCAHIVAQRTAFRAIKSFIVITGLQGGEQRYIELQHAGQDYRLLMNQKLIVSIPINLII